MKISSQIWRVASKVGAAFGVFVVCASIASSRARADACHPEVDPTVPQYIIGYGSLMQTGSKRRTAPDTGENLPVMMTGYQRAWNTKGSSIGFSTTYLGVQPEADAQMVAALYRVFDVEEIRKTDDREAFYCRERAQPDKLRMLDGSSVPATGQIWIYVNRPENVDPPSERFPIVQSYVDIFVTGCFELKQKVVGENLDFAEACITTTHGWSADWVNDRPTPRRPFIDQPKASAIDALLQKMVPDQFKKIRIE